MLYTVKCPNCGAEQKGLDLQESNGSVYCYDCEKQFEVDIEEFNKQIEFDKTAE